MGGGTAPGPLHAFFARIRARRGHECAFALIVITVSRASLSSIPEHPPGSWRGARADRWPPALWPGHRTSQNAIILDRLVSEVAITDPQHPLFGRRLALTNERSGRGPAYVAVRLPDGHRRSIRISATDLNASDCSGRTPAASLPRINVRILIPLAQHLDRILDLLTEEVIRDDPTSAGDAHWSILFGGTKKGRRSQWGLAGSPSGGRNEFQRRSLMARTAPQSPSPPAPH